MKDKNKYISLKEKSPVLYWAYTIASKIALAIGITVLIFITFALIDKIMGFLYNINTDLPVWFFIALIITIVLVVWHDN